MVSGLLQQSSVAQVNTIDTEISTVGEATSLVRQAMCVVVMPYSVAVTLCGCLVCGILSSGLTCDPLG